MASKIKVDQIDTTLGSGNVTIDPDNNTLVVDTDNSRVGIGITSADGKMHIFNSSAGTVTAATDANELVLESSANVGMSFLTANSSIARIKFGDPDATNAGVISYNHADDSLRFNTNGSERLRILSSGGLTFNGDTAAANALDDYEEGTFTPTAEDESDNVGSAGEATGYYRKIGGLVHVEIRFTNINTTGLTSSEDIVIGGLPFTHSARNGSVFAVSGNVYHSSLNLDFSGNIIALLGEGQAFIKLVEMNDSGGDHDIQVADLTSGVADILMSLTYHTEQ